MKWINRAEWAGWASKALIAGAVLMATGAGGAGCLTRPVGTQPPTTKVNFTSQVAQQQVDKVDLLFAIDNSPSMADKQNILSEAVPNLLHGLVYPQCVMSDGTTPITPAQFADPTGTADNNYGCPQGSQPEFKPITDMHIGVVSSSLGSFGGDLCDDARIATTNNPRLNDRGRLLNPGDLANANPSHFLAWFPSNQGDPARHPAPPVPAIANFDTLQSDFQSIVAADGQAGCAFESQIESVYHFLVQPDPWTTIITTNFGGSLQADLGGPENIDAILLKQRSDFLRSDSLVAVIMLTDEDDSSVDPLSFGGTGFQFMNFNFAGSTVTRDPSATTTGTTAPRATNACATDPASPNCMSCLDPKAASAPECNDPVYGPYYGPKDDDLNVRFFHMKQRFGVDPQYPLQRYIDGFTKARVPDRATEHVITMNADGTRNVAPYTYASTCTNPLFAAKLPASPSEEVCSLTPGSRTSDLVFFAVIGGVPYQSLYNKDPKTNADASLLSPPDWVKILGQDPVNFNYTGIDPHMVQSTTPRDGIPWSETADVLGTNDVPDQPADYIVGRDYQTQGTDLQYACTFDLPSSAFTAGNQYRSCSGVTDCDCDFKDVSPPLCSGRQQQIKAKAYPTIREFSVVRALGDQGIIASLCPISLTVDPTDPTYGYNPAVTSIINRLKNALTQQCLPRQLTRDQSGNVPCLVLARLAEGDTCDKYKEKGLGLPDPAILSTFLEQQKQLSGDTSNGGIDLSTLAVCQVPQITVAQGASCKANADIGWCYVENSNAGTPAGRCTQALLFSAGSAEIAGATFFLQCIQQFSPGEAAGDTDASQ
ncbi:MAG: hypothetical protein FWD73_03560 [Polyangiaceae bacterium]|nr:hypothetical protein [Polyangiaceae bacterium]